MVEEGRIDLREKQGPLLEEKSQEILKELEDKEKEKELPLKELPAKDPANYKSDNQLMRSVDILKAVKIYKGIK